MKDRTSLNLLIDKASAIAGSDYKLAKALGTQRQVVSDWRHGRKTATPADQALMADLAGLDPVVTLARATVEQFEGKAKGDAHESTGKSFASDWRGHRFRWSKRTPDFFDDR